LQGPEWESKPFVAGIRAVSVTTPAMLGDLLKGLAQGRIDLNVVAEFGERYTFERKLRSISPDLVVIGLRGNEASTVVLPMLRLLPTAKFIAFSSDLRQAFGYELRTHGTSLTDLSPEALIDFINTFVSVSDG
jgi:hypothetical protein